MAAPNSVTYDYDNIATTTLSLMRSKIADAIFKANPTIAWLLGAGRVRLESGGRYIEEPILYQKNDTTQSYRGYDPLNIAPTDELTMARYNWRQSATSVAISGLEELQNSGPAQVFNNLKQKIKVAEMSKKEYFNEMALADTATKDLSRDLLGFDEIIENAATQGYLGGIDKNTYSWWQNQRLVPSATWTVANRTFGMTLGKFFNTCSKGLTRPDFMVTTQAMYENLEAEQWTYQRYPTQQPALNIGFPSMMFKGVPVFWDEYCQTDHFYVVNSEFLNYVIHSRRNFAMTPFMRPHNQDARVAQILFCGQMTCSNPRFQGILDLSSITWSGYPNT